jgi:hypothetical protein
MVQEVQQQWNWYQTPNRIEWIWISERKLSDKAQVRRKLTNMITLVSNSIGISQWAWEVFANSWTWTTTNWEVLKIVWWDVYMPLAWAYSVEYVPYTWYSQKVYKYTFKLYLDNKVIYEDEQYPWDHLYWRFAINVGRRNKLKVSLQTQDTASSNIPVTLKLIKL